MDERRKIVRLLMHNPVLSFNELWNKEGRSNKFAYHVKVLEQEGIIEKTVRGYRLANKGKKEAAYIEGATGKENKFPMLGVIIALHDNKNNKFLLLKRTKEPFYGYWSFHGGKLNFEQYIFECAEEKLKKKTGLKCNLVFKGMLSTKTYNNGKLSYNHQLFILKGENSKGKLIEQTTGGKNRWFTKEEINNLKVIPTVPYIVDIVLSKKFRWIEADRFQEDGEFKSIKILKDKLL